MGAVNTCLPNLVLHMVHITNCTALVPKHTLAKLTQLSHNMTEILQTQPWETAALPQASGSRPQSSSSSLSCSLGTQHFTASPPTGKKSSLDYQPAVAFDIKNMLNTLTAAISDLHLDIQALATK